jgi:hypothetical protein
MATAHQVIPLARASRTYRLGRFRVRFVDLGLAAEYRALNPHSRIRAFTTIWTPGPPPPAARERLEPAIRRAAHDALSAFTRALGHGSAPLLLGDLP